MENPSLNLSLLCLAPKYLDLFLWALSFGLHWRVDVHERASNHYGLRSFVREKVALGEVRVLHVPSQYQFADIMTKGLPVQLF